jgi:hypothetical protein
VLFETDFIRQISCAGYVDYNEAGRQVVYFADDFSLEILLSFQGLLLA